MTMAEWFKRAGYLMRELGKGVFRISLGLGCGSLIINGVSNLGNYGCRENAGSCNFVVPEEAVQLLASAVVMGFALETLGIVAIDVGVGADKK